MPFAVKPGEIYQFRCCNEGRCVIEAKDKTGNQIFKNQDGDNVEKPTHFFLILSPESYNKATHRKYISALPITSSKGGFTVNEYGFNITGDDIDHTGIEFVKNNSNILFDRPLRLRVESHIDDKCRGTIQSKAFRKIVSKMIGFFGTSDVLIEEYKK